MTARIRLITGLLLAAVLLALVGPGHPALAQAGESRVRFLHAVPGAPEVDIYLDGALVVSGLGFGEATPHVKVAGGDHQVVLRQAGLGAESPVLVEAVASLRDSLAFTLVAQGQPNGIQVAQYEDILDEINLGLARMAMINTVADSPALDLLTREKGAPQLQGVSYGNTQFGTVNVPAGVLDLVVVPAGGAVTSALIDVGQVRIKAGMLYTFVVFGTLDSGAAPSALVLGTPVNAPAQGASVLVQFAHGSPDAPAVDVYANDVLVVPAMELGEMSGHMALATGDYAFGLRPAGTPAADPAAATLEVTLDGSAPAVTVAALGELGDSTLALESLPDNVAGLSPDMARIGVLNAVPGATVTARLTDAGGTVLVTDLVSLTQGSAVDAVPGETMVNVSIAGIDNPVDLPVPVRAYHGGVYYTVLVYGGGAGGTLYDARVSGTEVNVTVDSLAHPPEPVAVAVEPTPEALPTAVEVQPALPTPVPTQAEPAIVTDTQPPANSEVVVLPTPGSELVVAETETAAPDTAPQPVIPQTPRPVAYVELNPGANLHCRELPGPDKRSLGLIPSGTTLTVVGRTGTPLLPETGSVTPEPTPVAETVEDLWLSVEWNPPGGGYMRCWVNAQFLRVEWKGKLLDEITELWELPEEPFNRPGVSEGTTITPPTPLFDAVLATVELEPGVSLQLRRSPQTDAESLALVPAGAQLEVLGYGEAPSEGLVGQPTDPNWLYVRYREENGGATIGWVSVQYVSISKLGREVQLTDLVVVDVAEQGYYEAPGTAPVIPIELQDVVGTINLNPGANLNLRDQPNADARVVVGIPSGSSMVLNGRNGDGSWVQVTYESPTGGLDGWVASQYLIVTRGGQPYEIKALPILTGEADIMP